jgi:hypothetical protein
MRQAAIIERPEFRTATTRVITEGLASFTFPRRSPACRANWRWRGGLGQPPSTNSSPGPAVHGRTGKEMGTKTEEIDQSDSETSTSAIPEVAATPTERKRTSHLIERAIERLIRAGGRKSEAEAAHLLEGIAVLVYDPDTASILPDLPKAGSGLRWEQPPRGQ